MNIIKKKVDASTKVVDLFREYYGYFNRGFSKMKPDIVEKLKKIIEDDYLHGKDQLLKRISSLNASDFIKLNSKDQQKLIFQTYTLIIRIDEILAKIYELIDEYSFTSSNFIDSDISTSQKHESIIKENEIKTYYIGFIKAFRKITEVHIIDFFIDLILNTTKNLSPNESKKCVSYINSLFRSYPESINLYSKILQNFLDKYFTEDKEYRAVLFYIENILETDKAFVLQNINVNKLSNMKYLNGPSNPFIRSMGLIPMEEYQTIKDLFKDIMNVKGTDNSIFNSVIKKTGRSIILLRKITSNPVDYIIWNLIDFNKAKNLGLNAPKLCGITENLIKRMNTIKLLKKGKKWNFSSYKLYGSSDNESFYVIETLNDITYRFLCPWAKCTYKHIPRFKVVGLMKYLNIISSENIMDRISQYQYIHAKSLDKLFLKSRTDIEAMVLSSHIEIEAEKIKTEILFRIMIYIKKLVKTVNNPVKQISIIVHKKEIFDIFIDTIIELYKDFYVDPLQKDNRLKFKPSEMLSIYIADISRIKRLFRKELHKLYMEKQKNEIYNIESMITVEQIIVYIQLIIQQTLDNIMTHKSNIYQSMLLKANMMKIGLI